MEIKIVGSTNGITTANELLLYGRSAARECYTEKDFSAIADEPNPEKLTQRVLSSGHHHVFDHPYLTFEMKDIPKLLAMILNNEKVYATAEKSARYTKMRVEGEQKALYDKWMGIFQERILIAYPFLDPGKAEKLAQENARYVTSVFIPTKMLHTLSFRQLNRVIKSARHDLSTLPDFRFFQSVKATLSGFINNETIKALEVKDLDYRNKKPGLSLFSQRAVPTDEFGENYVVTYNGSFAQLAQAHRHRTLDYRMTVDESNPRFFTPLIIAEDESLADEWLQDMSRVAESDYPQGMLVEITESGSHDNFMAKCHERLCGNAQLEIMYRTRRTLFRYLSEVHQSNFYVYNALEGISHGPKCTFPGMECMNTQPCLLGPNLALERLI